MAYYFRQHPTVLELSDKGLLHPKQNALSRPERTGSSLGWPSEMRTRREPLLPITIHLRQPLLPTSSSHSPASETCLKPLIWRLASFKASVRGYPAEVILPSPSPTDTICSLHVCQFSVLLSHSWPPLVLPYKITLCDSLSLIPLKLYFITWFTKLKPNKPKSFFLPTISDFTKAGLSGSFRM